MSSRHLNRNLTILALIVRAFSEKKSTLGVLFIEMVLHCRSPTKSSVTSRRPLRRTTAFKYFSALSMFVTFLIPIDVPAFARNGSVLVYSQDNWNISELVNGEARLIMEDGKSCPFILSGLEAAIKQKLRLTIINDPLAQKILWLEVDCNPHPSIHYKYEHIPISLSVSICPYRGVCKQKIFDFTDQISEPQWAGLLGELMSELVRPGESHRTISIPAASK